MKHRFPRRKLCQVSHAEFLETRTLLDASGIFAAPSQVMLPDGGFGLLLGDTDRDGDLDAVVIAGDGFDRVFTNNGRGDFLPANATFGAMSPRATQIADIDGDGLLDFLAADETSGTPGFVELWRNLGGNSFELMARHQIHGVSIDAVDVDHDGDTDVIVGSNSTQILKNVGLGNFTATALPFGGPSVVADFNNDGSPDILVNSQIAMNDGSGNFQSSVSSGVRVYERATCIADFDGDGDIDVYRPNDNLEDGTARIFMNDGTGQFTPSSQILSRRTNTSRDRDSVAGDVDHDGDIDLIVQATFEGHSQTTVWTNDGTGNFVGSKGPFEYPQSIVLGDVDSDGDLDLVDQDGFLRVARNRTVTTVQLPASGGNFEAIRSGSDLVVRRVSGAEVFREAAAGIRTLRILGSAASDRIDGSSLTGIRLVMNGGDGDDTLIGGSASDSIDGGNGNDSIFGNDGADQIAGGAGTDWLSGNLGQDRIDGGDDSDTIIGGSGHDELRGGNGNDQLNGGSGNDRMYGEAGTDVLRADAGNDLLDGGTEADTLVGDDGNDSLLGGDGDDLLRGVAGRDTLDGGAGNDDLRGGADNDSVIGGLGDDTLNGNIGNDTLLGGDGNDALSGGTGHDQLLGQAGQDTLLGNSGNDSLYGGADADILLGDTGNDHLDGEGHSRDTLNGGSGTNVLIGLPSEIDATFVFDPDWDDRS